MKITLIIPDFQSLKSARGQKQATTLPCVPSWNDMMSMQQWARAERKKQIENAFLSALRACDADCSTKTTSASSW